jgi:hypothetical protein
VSLVLRDFDGSPDEITRILGISPSTSGARGDPERTRSGQITSRLYRHSFWIIRSTLPSSATFEQHVRALLDAVEPITKRLREIGPPTLNQIYCSVIPDGAVPMFELQNETLLRLADTGCGLVIDVLYIDPEED